MTTYETKRVILAKVKELTPLDRSAVEIVLGILQDQEVSGDQTSAPDYFEAADSEELAHTLVVLEKITATVAPR